MPRDRSDSNKDAAWLLDMLTAAKAVRSFVSGRTLEQYLTDLMLRSAVERQVEIIGEAARGLSVEYKLAHPEIPWRSITAQRHRLAHEYGEINDNLIWTVATVHITALIDQLVLLVPPPPEE
ncbi:MAG: DUF86 domain-containing protein, partial [Burkholderiales bacterium]|nr:DUF86 domain-containing protein [Phycisphaerae bacterium]